MIKYDYNKSKRVNPIFKGMSAEPVRLTRGKVDKCANGSYRICSNGLTDMINMLNHTSFILE